MKIQAIKEITTVSPEKHWSTGEIMDLPDDVANQLLTNNPNFRKIREAPEPISRVKMPTFPKRRK